MSKIKKQPPGSAPSDLTLDSKAPPDSTPRPDKKYPWSQDQIERVASRGTEMPASTPGAAAGLARPATPKMFRDVPPLRDADITGLQPATKLLVERVHGRASALFDVLRIDVVGYSSGELFSFSVEERIKALSALLKTEEDASLDARGPGGISLVHSVIVRPGLTETEKIEFVHGLADLGADLNLVDEREVSPLQAAHQLTGDQSPLVEALSSRGAILPSS